MMDAQYFVSLASTTIFVLGTTLNLIFIYMIRNGTRNAVGQVYKHILTSFAVCNIAFASAEFIAKPGIHIYGTSLMTFSHGYFQQVKPWGFLSLCVFIGMYGNNTALLSLHFIYRYIVVCRQQLTSIFHNTVSVVIVILSVLSWGCVYGFITFYCFAATNDYYNYANPSVHAKFGKDAHELSFFCIFTHEVKDDITIIHWSSAIGVGIIFAMMIVTFAVMVICAIKIYRALKSQSSMSQKSRKLHTRLLKALIIQAIIPFFTSYLSRIVMYTSVVMGLQPLRIYAFTPLVVSIYTVIDPIAIMIFVCDYRKTVKNLKRNMQHLFSSGLRASDSKERSQRQSSVGAMEANVARKGRPYTTVF